MNDKVIYVGNYYDGTGWGNAALHNILAMDSVGIDVVPRPITFEQDLKPVPDRIRELEQKSTEGAKYSIQHTLPPLYSADTNLFNIGFYETESDLFRRSLWPKFINNMDAAWVANNESAEASLASGVHRPINVVPHCLPIEEYNPNDESTLIIPEASNTFNFLFIGEMVERKNLEALVKAFHTEFHPRERVSLIIKTSFPNSHGQNTFELAKDYINGIRGGLKLRKNYSPDIIFASFLKRDHYLSIIRQSHCFVMPSRGEACCIPALEAGLMGLPVLYTEGNGMGGYTGLAIDGYDKPVNSVKSMKTSCYNTLDTIPDLQSSNENWHEISVLALRDSMRRMFELWKNDRELYDQMSTAQVANSMNFSYETIGETIKEILNAYT